MTPAIRRCVRAALAGTGLIVALGVAACDLIGGDQLPPKSLLTGLISANDTYDPKGVRLIQLASYFGNGHWRKIGSTTYTLRVSQKDPTSDKTNALGFLIKEVDRPGGETLADITHATLNGDDLTDIDVVNLVNELDLPPIPAAYPPAPGSEPVARQPSPPADLSVFRPGMNFEEVQEKLGMLGIKPAPIPRPSGDQSCGAGQEDICRSYPAIIDCTGMGMDPCRAAFIDNDGRIAVASTAGDNSATMELTGIAWANAADQKRVRDIIAGKPEDGP